MYETEDKVFEYIKNNIGRSIREQKALKPVITPCIDSAFLCFFYWDTYFANLALAEIGNFEQIENNLDNMKWFVDTLGFVPNAYEPDQEDNGLNRSQPPLFARGVWDYYCIKNDIAILKKYLPALEREHEFWQKNRMTPCGLNRYWHHATDKYLLEFYDVITERLKLQKDAYEDKIGQGAHFLAIAESGWDFTCRFPEEENVYACGNYAPVDLNSILYDQERIIARANDLLGNQEKSQLFNQYAEERREKMNRYMLSNDGFYYDYNFITNTHSPYLSSASFCPFAMGVSDDLQMLEKTLNRLEEEHGVTSCEKKDRTIFDQWDYPTMWPPLMYFCVTALKRLKSKHFIRVADKYLSTVRCVFEKTSSLWEKYDSVQGGVAVTREYGTHKMMGWTAGVYAYILKNR